MARIFLTNDQTDYLLEQMRIVEIGAKNTVDYLEARLVYDARFNVADAHSRAVKQHTLAKEIIGKLNGAKMAETQRLQARQDSEAIAAEDAALGIAYALPKRRRKK